MSSQTDAVLKLVKPSGTSDALKLWSSALTADAKAGDVRLFYGQGEHSVTALVSLGKDFEKKSPEARRELIRKAVGSGTKKLKGAGAKSVAVDVGEDEHAAAVAAHLGAFNFTLKTKEDEKKQIDVHPVTKSEDWARGEVYAQCQNLARELAELPANMLTPTKFCERVTKEFDGLQNVEVITRDKAWVEEKGMRTFLSVASGSVEPPKFLEIHYRGGANDAAPIALVGKGITFDSGGISIKPAAGMKLMRGDMGGAAAVMSTLLGIAKLKLPINIIAVTPLTENLPSAKPNKPGDVIVAMNGKTVEVDNTDAEGRLVLSDALHYVTSAFKPHTVIDVATLTGAMVIGLGEVFTGVFSTSDSLWEELQKAGEVEFDRFWRMPLDEGFGPQIYSSNADLCNTGGRPGGSCTAALFLKAFVNGIDEENGKQATVRWAHIDIAGTMEATRAGAYQNTGMTGRPVRGLIEFIRKSAKA